MQSGRCPPSVRTIKRGVKATWAGPKADLPIHSVLQLASDPPVLGKEGGWQSGLSVLHRPIICFQQPTRRYTNFPQATWVFAAMSLK